AVAISLTVIRDQGPVVHDVSAQCRQGLDQLREAGISLAEGLDRALQIINLAEGFVDLTRPQRPFETLALVAYLLTQLCLARHQTFAVLAQYRQLHREVKPVQYMSRLGAHLQLEGTQCVMAIGKKRHLLVHLHALRVQHLMQASLWLGVVIRLDKPTTFVPRGLGLFTFAKAQRTLAPHDLEVALLVHPVAHVPSLNARLQASLRQWYEVSITGIAFDKTRLFVPQLR